MCLILLKKNYILLKVLYLNPVLLQSAVEKPNIEWCDRIEPWTSTLNDLQHSLPQYFLTEDF
jgi:hypothetical protein